MLFAPASASRHLAIDDLRPTQMSLGLREVAVKRAKWRAKDRAQRNALLSLQQIPVVAGPRGRFYLLDGHHLARVLYEEGESSLAVHLVEDLSRLGEDEFWRELHPRGWIRACGPNGAWTGADLLPAHIKDMVDDPYRSLAGELRRRGGFTKDQMPFSEFAWADYLRKHIDPVWLANDFDWAVARALELAAMPEASFLPGWSGGVMRG
jgi:hypothetical protein